MSNQSNAPSDTSKLGLWMFIAAWVVAIGFLLAFFSGMLERKVNPNQTPNSVVSEAGVSVILKRNAMGHYLANGEINGKEVTFLLDTGATNVSIGEHLSSKLGLTPGQSYRAQTANGTVIVAATTINELKLGGITLRNVEASLNPGLGSDEILLGMSALKQLQWTQRGDVLTISTF